MRTAVANQKGGVGKTMVASNVGYCAAEKGLRVLVVDLDSQANATAAMLPDLEDTSDVYTVNDVLDSGQKGIASEAIRQSPWHDNLFIIPSELALANRDRDSRLAFEQRLRKTLDGADDTFDLVLIDCPPSPGLLTVNALVAADNVLVVTHAARSSVQGLVNILDTVEEVHDNYNARLSIAGVVVNQFEARTREMTGRLKELDAAFGEMVWHPPIPKRAAIVEAFGSAVPICRMPDGQSAWDAINRITDQLLAVKEA